MTPHALADLHHAAFTRDRGWSADEFAGLLDSPHVQLLQHPGGFALVRTVAGESELLTLAVDPAHQRQGLGHLLLQDWMKAIRDQAETAFLEVASDNDVARRLYARCGFAVIATRPAYYARTSGPAADALIMSRALTPRQA